MNSYTQANLESISNIYVNGKQPFWEGRRKAEIVEVLAYMGTADNTQALLMSSRMLNVCMLKRVSCKDPPSSLGPPGRREEV